MTVADTRMTGGEAVVRSLVAQGIVTLYALSGVQSDWLFNALHDAKDQVRVIHTRHEQGAVYMALGHVLATDLGHFVDEMTQVGYAAQVLLPVYHSRTFISSGYMGTLGYGFVTALGVRVARPDVPVISVTGDGGFLFAVNELATAVKQGNVARMQRVHHGNRAIATQLHNPDFVSLAEPFGALGMTARSPAELADRLSEAIDSGHPSVIEVPVGDMPDIELLAGS